ncbi:MAG: winged helix-turn-helix domain-containing protein, partial [Caldilineaceae bacterium]|nr:winged helix-turn-helix domain-containing protein [Caldilineaceae bacterium]
MPHLSINVLGPPTVTLDGQSIIGSAYAKAWALLVYLAYASDHPHRRETLAGLLWPDQSDEQARTNLRQALARLRQALDDANATPPHLFADRTSIQFNAAGNATVDVAKFTTLLAACTAHDHRHAETCAACAARREEAVALYRGAFLEGF